LAPAQGLLLMSVTVAVEDRPGDDHGEGRADERVDAAGVLDLERVDAVPDPADEGAEERREADADHHGTHRLGHGPEVSARRLRQNLPALNCCSMLERAARTVITMTRSPAST